MANDRSYSEPRHPIRVAAERTGLTPVLIRAWERRYEVVTPGRDEAGDRIYSDADIDRLGTLARLAQAGRSVGTLARMSPVEIERLAGEDAAHRALQPASADVHRAVAAATAAAIDPERLFQVLKRAVLSLGTTVFLEQVLAPLITDLGDDWHNGRTGIAREHAASVAIEQLLGWIIREFGAAPDAPRLLLATPSGERHALGSVMAAAMASHDAWQVSWLGVDLPAAQIAVAAEHHGSHVVALGIVASDGRSAPREEVAAVRAALPQRVPLLLGGSGAAVLGDIPGVVVVNDLNHFRALIARHTPLHSNG